MIHPLAEIEPGTVIGEGTRIWARAHIREAAVVGRDCVIGENVFIDTGVRVGDRCKVQNGALLYRGATLADEVFVGPAACLTNDRRPRAATPTGELKTNSDWEQLTVAVNHGASIGAHAVVVGGVSVGRWAMVGAGAVVTSNVPDHGLVVGTPAAQAGWVCLCGQALTDDLSCSSCGRHYQPSHNGLELQQ